MTYRLSLVLSAALVAGCRKPPPQPADPPAPAPTPAPPPAHSGADRPTEAGKSAGNVDGPGYPDRLPAPAAKAVRGDLEIWVEGAGRYGGDDFVVAVSVKARTPGVPLAFTSWGDTGKVTLTDGAGRTYARRPLLPLQDDALRDWTEKRTDTKAAYGTGPVTHDRARLTFVAFDPAAFGAGHLDLDLDGGSIGDITPILFRIPKEVWESNKK
ncbi:hypothetical protein J0H58_08465 [bacterium]|nr:hypothetical protein [bacterium]